MKQIPIVMPCDCGGVHDADLVRLQPVSKRLTGLIAAHGDLWQAVRAGHPNCLKGEHGWLIRTLDYKEQEWVKEDAIKALKAKEL